MSNIKKLSILFLIPMIFIETARAEGFKDIQSGDDYFLAINYLREKDIIEGYEDGSFKAGQTVNRAEALKMISKASGIFDETALETPDEKPFTDVSTDQWYAKYLSAAKEAGIIAGYGDGNFKPEREINLAETMKILFESYGDFDLAATASYLYEDTPQEAWFSKYAAYAGAKGIVNIYKSNTIGPDQIMTRGYLAEVIYRTMLAREGYEFGKATWYFGIDASDGNVYTSAHKYLPKGSKVEVTNLANGKSIEVEITDRGPYGPGRVLDLSSEAFSEIAWTGTGVIKVQYKVTYLP